MPQNSCKNFAGPSAHVYGSFSDWGTFGRHLPQLRSANASAEGKFEETNVFGSATLKSDAEQTRSRGRRNWEETLARRHSHYNFSNEKLRSYDDDEDGEEVEEREEDDEDEDEDAEEEGEEEDEEDAKRPASSSKHGYKSAAKSRANYRSESGLFRRDRRFAKDAKSAGKQVDKLRAGLKTILNAFVRDEDEEILLGQRSAKSSKAKKHLAESKGGSKNRGKERTLLDQRSSQMPVDRANRSKLRLGKVSGR